MTGTRLLLGLGVVSAGVLLANSGAHADAIDGDWCADDGRHMAIAGPVITTPAGIKTEGRYGRHSFAYSVPSAEPNAGTQISMLLINEETLHLRKHTGGTGPTEGPLEVWRRCDYVS